MHTNKSSPDLVNGEGTDTSALGVADGCGQRALEADGSDQHDQSTAKLAETLHGENGSHHCSSPLGGSEPIDVS